MKTTKITMMLLTIVTVILLSACAKDGKTGPQGPAGTNGTNGNANVVSSSITTTSLSWSANAPFYTTSIGYAAITQDIIDNGAVLVYISNTAGTYQQLPFTYYPASSYSRTYTFAYAVGTVTIYVSDSDLVIPDNPGAVTFKIVVMAASAKRELQQKHVDLNNYSEVVTYLNIQ